MYVWDDKKKQYVSDTPASRIPVKDSAELFDSNNVEGALAELAGERDAQGITLQDHTGKIENLTEAVDWLKANGGGGGGTGGGGTVMPIISTTDELSQVVPKGQEIVLNVFFSSPNLGQGSLVLLINNKEVNSFTIKQGSNSINIGALKELRNKIVIYVKDRANLVSNEITYNIINGGVSLTLDFDYYADYPADKDVLMRYNIDTDQEDVQLEVTVDNNKSSVACKNGYNEYYFKNLTVGIHAVTVRAVSGQFISETYNFNLVIINSDSLYISSTFGENPKCTLGVPVVIDYRISYKDDTAITLVLTLDGKVNKTLTSKRGSYAWTLNDMTLGSHSYKIDCTLGADNVSLEGTFVVEAGDYTPLQINTDGLRYQMGCVNRTNQDDDKEEFIYDNGTSQITTRLKGFNFETNGWIDGALVCNGGAYAEIDYACMAENAPYSLTVEVDFKATDIGLPDARILECRDATTKKGFHVTLNEAKLNSVAQEARVYITPEERTTVSLQIDRQSKFAKIYVNGIITSAFYLTDSGSGTSTVLENFAHNGKIYVGCDKDLGNIGNCTIYDIRVYERRVSNDDIVKNVIAQEKDLRKQEDLYNFCFNNNTLSTMRLYSDEVENKVSNMTNTNKITMRAVYRSTNTEKYGQPFELKYCKVYWQGTSSLDYIRKNYNLELYDDDLKEFYYSPYPNAVQEYLFCLKCDYMESSHARNVGIGNLINKYWYTSKNPAQLKNDMVQNAVQGFPMLLYINDEFMGVYNFNTDRYSNASFGYTGDECLAYEVSANSDKTAGAFIAYDKTKHEGNEIDYYKTDFMCLYPPTRRAGNDTMDEIKALVIFVDKSSDEEFVTNINNNLYFNKEYLLRYLIYCLVMGAVDSLGKNMKLATWDNGKTWYPQIYDCDTTMGLDNSGMLFYDTNIKIQAGVYNTSSSRLWSRLMELMWADIQAEYVKMRNTTLTLENIYECIITNQMDCIPATYYNSDCETKYLQFKSSFLDALHGQGKQQVTEWLRARLLYIDTYMEYWTTTSDFVSLRSAKEGKVYIDLEMFDNMFVQIKWRNTGEASDNTAIQIQEVKKGEVMRFSFDSKAKTDQEIRIFGGKYVKSLGDLSNLSPVRVNITSATRLTDLVCHSDKLKTVELSTCTNLQRVDLKDCTILGSSDQSTKLLNVSGCTNIQYINLLNTQIQGVNLNPKGSNIQEIWYPKDIQSIVLANCPHLTIVGLQRGHSCKELRLTNCPNVETFGDLKWDSNKQQYTYTPAYYLTGVQTLYIDNSLLDFEDVCLENSINLQSVTFRNMPKLKSFRIGNDFYNQYASFDAIATLDSAEDLVISSFNCPNFKDFYVLRGTNTEYIGKCSMQGVWCNGVGGRFIKKTLDISNSSITNMQFRVIVLLKNLILHKDIEIIDINTLKNETNSNIFNKIPNWEDYYYTDSYFPSTNMNGSDNNVHAQHLIFNVWERSNNKYSEDTSEYVSSIWDFEGIQKLKSLNINKMNRRLNPGDYSEVRYISTDTYCPRLTNLNIKITDGVAPCLRPFETGGITNCSFDYSEYVGRNYNGIFQGLDTLDTEKNITIKFPSVLGENIQSKFDCDNPIRNLKTDLISWKDVEPLFPKMRLYVNPNPLLNVTLKEQKDATEKIDINIPTLNNSLGNNNNDVSTEFCLFGSCNIKYVGELIAENADSVYRLFYGNQSIISIDRLYYKGDSPATWNGFRYVFINCSNLEYIGMIESPCTIGVNLKEKNFTGCNKLRCVEGLNFKIVGIRTCFSGLQSLEYVNFPERVDCTDMSSGFKDCPNIDITKIKIPQGITNLDSLFDGKDFSATPNIVWDVSYLEKSVTMPYIFRNCTGIKSLTIKYPNIETLTPYYYAFQSIKGNLDKMVTVFGDKTKTLNLRKYNWGQVFSPGVPPIELHEVQMPNVETIIADTASVLFSYNTQIVLPKEMRGVNLTAWSNLINSNSADSTKPDDSKTLYLFFYNNQIGGTDSDGNEYPKINITNITGELTCNFKEGYYGQDRPWNQDSLNDFISHFGDVTSLGGKTASGIKNQLTDEQIAELTAKGWTIA